MTQYKIGLVVNPIAGMGGKVGLKGTDGVLKKAKKLGAIRIAPSRATAMIKEFCSMHTDTSHIKWYTCADEMGYESLKTNGLTDITNVYSPASSITTAEDTKKGCAALLSHNIDLLIFCGGDGTARDVFASVGTQVPILGIPSGVKMHSAVFGITPLATAKILHEFIAERLTIGDVEIMDLDEARYRNGEWNIELFGIAKGIVEPTYVQVGKAIYESVSDDVIKEELAEHIADMMHDHPDTLFLFGSGGTIDYIAKSLSLKNTLLGVDAIYQHKVIGTDLNEQQILTLLNQYTKTKLLISPIGAQGFIFGRGNLQLSATVIKKISLDNIIIVSTPAKLLNTPLLRVDTGDKTLDHIFAEYEFFMVVIGYRLSRVVRIQTNNF